MEKPDYTKALFQGEHVPKILREHDAWCLWHLSANQGGKPTKVPDQSTANLNKCRTWDEVKLHVRDGKSGIGHVMTSTEVVIASELGSARDIFRYIALDCDGCRHPVTGVLEPWVIAVIEHFNSYTEVTPSLTGVRVWLLVRERDIPKDLASSKIRVPHPAPEGVTKTPEIQIFGLGVAEYVTVTGWKLAAVTDHIVEATRVSPFVWLLDQFNFKRGNRDATIELPVGSGDAPSLVDIEKAVCNNSRDATLSRGEWQELFVGKSASEAFHQLVICAVRGARGHGNAAVDYLLSTAWGKGRVHDSADPLKYTRRDWVAKDVARVCSKLPLAVDPGSVFDELPVPTAPPRLAMAELPETGGRLIDTVDFIFAAGDMQWLVKGLLPRVGVSQLYGDPGCGKTPLALSLAIRVAAGLDTFFDHSIKRHGKVVYMVGEGRSGLARRLRAECKVLGIEVESLKDKLLWSVCPGKLTDAEDVAKWFAEIKARCGDDLALIVVDTQARNFGGGNENSTQDMNLFVNNLSNLTEGLGCHTQLVHHTGHTNKDRGRGNSALFGALDACFEIVRDGREVTATGTKEKDWEKPEPLRGKLVPIELGLDEDGDPITAVTLLDEPPSDDEVFEDLEHELGEDENLAAVWKAVSEADGVATSVRQLAEDSGVNKTEVSRKIKLLTAKKLIRVKRQGKNMAYPLTDKGDGCRLSQKPTDTLGQLGQSGDEDLFE